MFEKLGGNLGAIGCVSYLFDRKGLILLSAKTYKNEDVVMEAALNAGAEDFERDGDSYAITTDIATFTAVVEALKAAGFEPTEADIKQQKLSAESPIARAIMDKAVGDVAEVQTPKGVRRLRVATIT